MNYDCTYIESDNERKFLSEIAKKDYARKTPLSVQHYKNATVLPRKQMGFIPYKGRGGVVDENKKFVEFSADFDLIHPELANVPLAQYAYGGGYSFDNPKFCNETVIYGGACHLHWGHFLIEGIQRLWYVLQDERNYKVVYSAFDTSEDYCWKDNFKRFFELLGIPDSRVVIVHEPTKFAEIIVPEQSMYPGEWWTSEYRDLFEKIAKSVDNMDLDLEKYDKIYLSRTMFSVASAREIGESIIEQAFKMNGFKVLYPEKLSLDELVFYMRHVSEVACISGTLSHNIMFAGNHKIKMIYLSKSHFPLYYQYPINQMQDVDLVQINVYKEPIQGFPVSLGPGPFWYAITDGMTKFFDDNGYTLPNEKVNKYEIFTYIKMCMKIYISRLKSKIKNSLTKS